VACALLVLELRLGFRQRHVAWRIPRQVHFGQQVLRCGLVGASVLRRLVGKDRLSVEQVLHAPAWPTRPQHRHTVLNATHI